MQKVDKKLRYFKGFFSDCFFHILLLKFSNTAFYDILLLAALVLAPLVMTFIQRR